MSKKNIVPILFALFIGFALLCDLSNSVISDDVSSNTKYDHESNNSLYPDDNDSVVEGVSGEWLVGDDILAKPHRRLQCMCRCGCCGGICGACCALLKKNGKSFLVNFELGHSLMASRTLRRRLHHGDVDGGRYDRFEASEIDSLNEPLLGNREIDDDRHPEGQLLDDERSKERLHWTMLFSHIIVQWAQWLANIVIGSGTLIGRFLPFMPGIQNGANGNLPPVLLSSLQEARLKQLKQRLAVPFDGAFAEHQDALRQLWRLAYPDRSLPSLKSELWKEMGWQGSDPSTDFRGGGFISLENLIFFAKTYPDAFQNLLHKRDGDRSDWEYPFAVAGINISFMLVQMLDIQSGKPNTKAGHRFLELLSEDEMAFDHLFCVAFKMLDAQWLVKRASYMEFNDVLKSTRSQLERELALEDLSTVRDLPAYNLLKR
ncbi:hypothetical protein BUALT_Bualt12G0047900 [Buddleja alternifolia]|uniref:ELMO domain-containing protein n=1 Tax=Buddleja alternifolia TaxID=168488 RepID=A0AAV6WTI9_9LAMI|nr:hypothetical protein BUALT_Bualt12G0047900 [Buddleja alternifolia]